MIHLLRLHLITDNIPTIENIYSDFSEKISSCQALVEAGALSKNLTF